LREVLASKGPYERQPRPLPADLQGAVAERWRFAFDFWGYPLERG
jgi:hypothetical protein